MAKTARQRRRGDAIGERVQLKAAAAKFPTWRAHVWRLLAIWGLVLVAYSNSFQSGLVFDNASIIGQDPRIRHATAANMGAIFTGSYRYSNPSVGLYRPLTTFSYLMNYAVFGNELRPAGYHWFNLLLHCVNVALVYALGLAVFVEAAPAVALAALWGVHPVLSESVTNIVGRADLLAALGVLAGLLLYLKVPSQGRPRKLACLAGMFLAQAAGIFSKESAVVLPGLMLLCDLTWSSRVPRRLRAYAYAAVAVPLAAYLYLRAQVHQPMVIPFADNPLVQAGFWSARLTAVKVIGRLTWLFLWPAHLSADYSFNAVPLFGRNSTWQDATAVIALALCLSAVALRGARRPALFFPAFFFIALLPTSNLVVLIGSVMAERFLYLPAIGLCGMVVAAIVAAIRRGVPRPLPSRAAWVAAAVVCCVLAGRTHARNFDWKDELSLWSSAVSAVPGSAKAHYNLAKALEGIPGRIPEAIGEYRESLRIDPDHADVHDNLANALSRTAGGIPEAIAEYQAALRIQPDRAEPHNDLANALATVPGRLPDAIAEYRAALRIQPANPEVHYNLANALVRVPGGESDAIAEYRDALRLQPDHADAHVNLANALARTSNGLPEAIVEYREALRIQPESAGAHIGLANALAATRGGLQSAIAEYQAALRIRPDSAEAHYDLGTALANIPGRLSDAIAEFRAAVRSQPDLVEAHVNLGNALSQTAGGRAEAIQEYEAALRIRPDPTVRQMLLQLRAEQRR